MLDTVKLKIKHFKIKNKSKVLYKPEFKKKEFDDLSENEQKRCPTSQIYFMQRNRKKDTEYIPPVIEIYESPNRKKEKVDYTLGIEFSVPKLLFGNNIEEIDVDNFSLVVSTLIRRLAYVGVIVTRESIENAFVSKVHFGKNIILPEEISMHSILEKISKIDINKNRDISKIRWKNSNAVHFYSGTIEQVFYEKIQDILQPKNKSENKDKTTFEMEMIEMFNLQNKEIFRYEYRLNKYNSVKSKINHKIGNNYHDKVVFKELFNKVLWKEIINESWEDVFDEKSNQITLFDLKNTNGKKYKYENVYNHLLLNAKKQKNNVHALNNTLITFALITLSQDLGLRLLKMNTKKVFSNETVYKRLNDKISNALKIAGGLDIYYPIKFISECLKKMNRITRDLL